MVLAFAAFLIMAASAALGILMLFGAGALSASPRWRRAGLIALGGGACGIALALAGLLAVVVLTQLHVAAELWLLLAAAGFGWAALVALAAYLLLSLLRQPNRWVDRKRKPSHAL